MRKKIGISLMVVTLLITALLFLAGVPPAQHVRVVHASGQGTMIDSSWQVHWYALALVVSFIAGLCLTVFGSHEEQL